MKKLILIFLMTMSSIASLKAAYYLVCIEGQAYLIQPAGVGNPTVIPAGGCGGGNWVIELEEHSVLNNPGTPEATGDQYAMANTNELPLAAESIPKKLAEKLGKAIAAGTIPKVWVDPNLLSPSAYTRIYGSSPVYEIYNISNSYDVPNHNYNLNIRSNAARTISVVIKDVNGISVYSNSFSIPQGQSTQNLGSLTGLSGVYSIWITTATQEAVDQITLGL